uniref:Uncharacterized protein n=1 Tax=Aegilops tauschii subsp. strangulata TaxID=200361 RepID=A0A453KTD4_AEGTS
MLTCIACSRQLGGGVPPLHEPPEDEDVVDAGAGVGGAATPSTRQAIKALTAQVGLSGLCLYLLPLEFCLKCRFFVLFLLFCSSAERR